MTETRHRPLAALLALVFLADVLFWGHAPGLSLAIFALALFAAALRARPRPVALAVLVLAVLPVVEFVQPLSVLILALGLVTGLALQAGPGQAPWARAGAILRQVPGRAMGDLGRGMRGVSGVSAGQAARGLAQRWALPLGGGLVLAALLAEANPVLDLWLQDLANLPFDPALWLRRVLFWAGVAILAWPLILSDAAPLPPAQGPRRPQDPGAFGLNAASVARALVLFNAGLALQSALDARYLWAGTTPPGMTLAAYAHRGAYPLLATALLAGAFALAARPFVARRPLLKPLLHLWLAQNILLTLSALYRLDLYVQAYGLTYLRIHAAIWMALVAAGLALTLWQVARNHGAAWLLRRCAVLGGATLYLASFVNFADLIARTNVAMGKIDTAYLCSLGPTAAASLRNGTTWIEPQGDLDSYRLYDSGCRFTLPHIDGWRDWGFRNWRVLNTLATQEARP